jgi:hypothetical protein
MPAAAVRVLAFGAMVLQRARADARFSKLIRRAIGAKPSTV